MDENIYITLQNQQIKTVLIPTNFNAEEIFACALLRTVDYRIVDFVITDDYQSHIDTNEKKATTLVLNMGDGRFNAVDTTYNRPEDGTRLSIFGLIWDEIKPYYSQKLQDDFDPTIVRNVETGGLLAKLVLKINGEGTRLAFTKALNIAFAILKQWILADNKPATEDAESV